jgi:succinyl-diaminopimelate desuccinylase
MPDTLAPAATDTIELTRALVRCESVTPREAGALQLLEKTLGAAGFRCERMDFSEKGSDDVANLYARIGEDKHGNGRHFCFAGHSDVVPVGDLSSWTIGPFAAELSGGYLFGRGAADMKGAVAAFIAAADGAQPVGSLSLLITGDEEGDAVDGTGRVVEALQAEGERIDHCVLGEPSSAAVLCDQMKIGRRGSLNAWITVEGKQGHVAYPDRSANPIAPLIRLLDRLQARVLDDGHAGFPPSNLEVTTIDVGNPATNVIPKTAKARLNIRFNPGHSGAVLGAWIEAEAAKAGEGFDGKVTARIEIGGEAFLTDPDAFVAVVAAAVAEVAGRQPELSTSGGTSDARFIRAMCPVVELGLVGATMHAVDERTPVAEILQLTDVYRRLIRRYFETFS